jgi:hypothetical protein
MNVMSLTSWKSHDIVPNASFTFPIIALSTSPSSPSCVSAPRIGLVLPVPHSWRCGTSLLSYYSVKCSAWRPQAVGFCSRPHVRRLRSDLDNKRITQDCVRPCIMSPILRLLGSQGLTRSITDMSRRRHQQTTSSAHTCFETEVWMGKYLKKICSY